MDHPGLFTAGGETAAPAEFLAAIQKVLEVCTLEPVHEHLSTCVPCLELPDGFPGCKRATTRQVALPPDSRFNTNKNRCLQSQTKWRFHLRYGN